MCNSAIHAIQPRNSEFHHVTFNFFGTAFTLFSFFLNFSAKKFGKPKMFDVSLHRHLKKKGAHDEHSTHTL